jgi:hypothetical protein
VQFLGLTWSGEFAVDAAGSRVWGWASAGLCYTNDCNRCRARHAAVTAQVHPWLVDRHPVQGVRAEMYDKIIRSQ